MGHKSKQLIEKEMSEGELGRRTNTAYFSTDGTIRIQIPYILNNRIYQIPGVDFRATMDDRALGKAVSTEIKSLNRALNTEVAKAQRKMDQLIKKSVAKLKR